MRFDREILSATLREMESERNLREQELQKRRSEAYTVIPRIRTIEDILRSTAARVVRASLESGTDPAEAVSCLREQNLKLQQERIELLVERGFADDYLSLRPACPQCADLGYIGVEPCSCLRKRYAQKLTERLSTVLPIQDQNFECFRLAYYSQQPDTRLQLSPRENMEDNLSVCREYAQCFDAQTGNLLLYGQPGLGKTFLSTSIAKKVSENGFSVAYDTAISILGHYETEKFSNANAQNASRQIRKYRQADLLIIDDLGAELTTAFTISALYDVINGRLMTKKAMIVNTNLTPGELEQRYTPAIASRILGEFTQLRFFGADIRLMRPKSPRS